MTAFARTSLAGPHGRFTLEIQSVNRKFLEIHCSLPKEFSGFELQLRKWIAQQVLLGQVQVTLRAHFDSTSSLKITPNLALAQEAYQAWMQIAHSIGLKADFDLTLLTKEDVLVYETNENVEHDYKALLEKITHDTLDQFIKVREDEGLALVADFSKRLDFLENTMKTVESLTKNVPEKQRAKLFARIKEILPDSIENEERIIRELTLYCDKVDVQEEIIRFYSHVNQFRLLLAGGPEGVGKTMDFLSQELGRELNTLGSKTPELEVTKCIIDMKTELSRIREQVQNVE